MSKLEVDAIEPQSGTTLTIGASGDTVNLASGATAGFGKVAQVITASTSTEVSNTTGTYADTGLTATITPSSTSSKILVLTNQSVLMSEPGTLGGCAVRLLRDATVIAGGDQRFEFFIQALSSGSTNLSMYGRIDITILDNPSTTSAITYKTQGARYVSGNEIQTQPDSIESRIILMEILG
jgi:hypothetical protein